MNLFLQEFENKSYYLLGKGKIYMKIQYLVIALVFAMLSVGCSEKREEPNELNKQSEMKEKILENSSDVIDPKPKEPETHGCLRGCRGLPCDEAARCVKRNCPSVNVTCEDGETEESKIKKIMETDDFKKLKHRQDKYNDSLNQENVRNLPRRPGPEGVLKNLMKLCKERGNCPNE
ncbi:hypothetical protein SAMN05720487_10893 [Fibrobacter sp. UWT2]|uniref:hypothetical protein n=1 Tax=Fibrobacter sp. UWT2 TaxID=1896224 RepID=UPI0009199565|nr:hypothetical protein [Fibrobacter sp. UWT2]SHL13728.1 hypothetical protein SAMN05720487_10893 [Fibrobacter sp. UWT2]